jgi:general nucleoside transport system permease protein
MKHLAPSVLSVLGAFVVCFGVLALMQGSFGAALDALVAMTWGGVGDWPRAVATGDLGPVLRPLGEAANKTAVLTLTGLSVAVAFRVGLFNIGAQGQMVIGAVIAAMVGQLAAPSALLLPTVLALAALGGAAWGALAGVLKARRGVHEVISTIMLNWVAIHLVDNWLVTGPWRGAAQTDDSIAGTAQIHAHAALPRLLGDSSRFHAGLLLAILMTVVLWLFTTRSVSGYRWRVVGVSPLAAEAAGISVVPTQTWAMGVAGGLAGLAGATLVLGTELKYPGSLGGPYGFDGLAMALLGQSHPWGVLASSAVFGILRAGGTRMQLLGVHKSFPELIQGVALLLVAAKWLWERLVRRA